MEKKRNRIRSKVPGQALTLGINRILWRWMKGKVPGRTEVEQNLRCLYTGDNIKERLEQYYAAKTGLLLKIATAGVAVTILLLATSLQKTELFEGVFLLRREKSYEKELTLKVEGEAARDMTIDVEPRELTREESRALLEKIKSRMDMYILGDNRTLDEVRSDLKLVTEIEGTPVTVSWELDSYDVLSLDGGLRPENIKEEGSIVELTAHMVCYGETAVYQAYAKVLPPLLNPEESFARELQEKLAQLQEEGKEAKEKELPGEVQGKALHWEEKVSGTPVMVLVLTLVCIPFLYMAKDRELGQQIQEREKQMCRDYAQIVSKLVLLLGAGTTVRNAWEQIVRDYQVKRDKLQIGRRYAYEEMALVCHEIQNGVAETRAYENFGLRCRIPCYLKLSALLEQNLKKGNKGLTELLQLEVREAFEQRKELARCQGEEAATRLLLPMILMLLVVMILILVPAGLSMQI